MAYPSFNAVVVKVVMAITEGLCSGEKPYKYPDTPQDSHPYICPILPPVMDSVYYEKGCSLLHTLRFTVMDEQIKKPKWLDQTIKLVCMDKSRIKHQFGPMFLIAVADGSTEHIAVTTPCTHKSIWHVNFST